MLRGDDPSAGDQPDAKPVFDLDPRQLLGDRAPPARHRRIAVRPQGLRPRRFLPRRRRQSDRSAARLAAERARTPRSTPARNSCRRSSAWMPAWCAATWRGWPSTASPTSCRSSIGIVPLRSAKSARWIKEKLFGAIIPDAIVERMERASDPAAEGRRICLDLVRELADIPHVAGVPHHGAGQRRRGAGHHQGGARQRRAPGASALSLISSAPPSPGRARTARGGCARRWRRRWRWRSPPPPGGSTVRRRRSAAARDG